MSDREQKIDLEPGEERALQEALAERDLFSARPSDEYLVALRHRLMEAAATYEPRPRRRRYAAVVGTVVALAAAAGLLLAIFWSSPTSPAWASALRRAGEQMWIHTRYEHDGVVLGEFWYSPERQIEASKFGESADFIDRQRGLFMKYDPGRRAVFRAPEPEKIVLPGSVGSFAELVALFRQASADRTSGQSSLAGEPVDRWTTRHTNVDGAIVDEYELFVPQFGGSGLPGHTPRRVIFTVDRATSLPRSMTVLEGDKPTSTRFFDYPQSGPTDIYSLGIPEGVPVYGPIGEEQLKVAVRSLRNACRDFDSYEALVVASPRVGRPLSRSTVTRVLRSGNKWRIDKVSVSDQKLVLPTDPEAGVALWRAQADKFRYYAAGICDGRLVHRYQVVPVNASPMNLAPKNSASRNLRRMDTAPKTTAPKNTSANQQANRKAFPQSNRSAIREFLVVPHSTVPVTTDSVDAAPFPRISRPECICHPSLWMTVTDRTYQIEASAGSPDQGLMELHVRPDPTKRTSESDLETLWLDPAKDYVATRIVAKLKAPAVGFKGANRQPSFSRDSLSGFRQSPHGFWYPTVVESQYVGESPGSQMPQITRYYVDFSKAPADELFEPVVPTEEGKVPEVKLRHLPSE